MEIETELFKQDTRLHRGRFSGSIFWRSVELQSQAQTQILGCSSRTEINLLKPRNHIIYYIAPTMVIHATFPNSNPEVGSIEDRFGPDGLAR